MKKILKFTIIIGLLTLVLLSAFLIFPHLIKAVKYTRPDIDDYKIFTNDTIEKGKITEWEYEKQIEKINITDSFETKFNQYQTAAFIVVQHGKIRFAKYWDKYNNQTLINAFSVAKSIISLLVGIAIDEGHIDSLNQKVKDFIPRFNDSLASQLTINDLLTMSSGSNWKEEFTNPVSDIAQAYYGNNLEQLINKIQIVSKPGQKWSYQCGNTLLLAEILKKATGQSITEYASEKIWKKIGAQSDALWSLDKKNGTVKSFCCFHATALDFARIGKLVLNFGEFDGNYVVPHQYIAKAIKPTEYLIDKQNNKVQFYGLHFWITRYKEYTIPYMRGMSGQYIFIIPAKDAVIVRLGNKRTEEMENNTPVDAFIYIEAALSILD